MNDLTKCLLGFFVVPGVLGALWIWLFLWAMSRAR